jgi:hypothetical protein
MKPAVCALCGKFATDNSGDWLEFADYEARSSDLSHPQGLVFFCDVHLSVAKSLSGLASEDALAKLQLTFPNTATEENDKTNRSWWKHLFNR